MSEFGKALRALREERGLSAYRLAKLAGIPAPQISRLERGDRRPTLNAIARLSTVFAAEEIAGLHMARTMDLLAAGNVDPKQIAEAAASVAIEIERGADELDRSLVAPQLLRVPVFQDIACDWSGNQGQRPQLERFPAGMVLDADRAVSVKGNSLRDLGFLPGTYLFIRSQPDAHNGQPVIARLDGETYTCKVFRDSGRRQWLEGRSETFKDRIYLDQHDVEILGVVVAFWGKP